MAEEKGKMTVMADFADRVKEKVKKDFAGMIPDNAWDQLVEKAVKEFIEKDLQAVVKEELDKDVRVRIRKYLMSDEWSQQYDGKGRNMVSREVSRLISENLPAIIESAIGGAMQGIVNDLRDRMTRGF
jgi:hypothetical protein